MSTSRHHEAPGRPPPRRLPSPSVLFRHTRRWLAGKRQLVIIASPHKVGSTWLYGMLAELCGYLPLRPPASVSASQPGRLAVDIELDELLAGLRLRPGGHVFKSHAFPPSGDAAALPAWLKCVTIIRDPRDVLVSSSFYLAKLPEAQGGWGPEFAAQGATERLLRLIERGGFLRDRLRAWHGCAFAHQVRYERLLAAPEEELAGLLSFLGEPVRLPRIADVCERHSFSRQTGRERGQEDPNDARRKGVAGDWKNHFDPRVTQAFKTGVEGDWNRLLLELGYERDPDWQAA